MKKVLVIGCLGAGKSYFSRELAAKTGLPLIPLDLYYHQDVWSKDKAKKKEQWRTKVKELVQGDEWIIDGNYKSTFDIRFPAADTVIFLDYPRWLTLWRAFARRLEYRNKKRPDMPEEWRERISWGFLKFIWSYKPVERPKLLSLIKQYAGQKVIHILRNPKEAREFLA